MEHLLQSVQRGSSYATFTIYSLISEVLFRTACVTGRLIPISMSHQNCCFSIVNF